MGQAARASPIAPTVRASIEVVAIKWRSRTFSPEPRGSPGDPEAADHRMRVAGTVDAAPGTARVQPPTPLPSSGARVHGSWLRPRGGRRVVAARNATCEAQIFS